MAHTIRHQPLPRKYWIFLSLIIVIIAAGIYWWTTQNQNKWMHIPAVGIRLPLKYDIHGIDVSHHNGNINWQNLRKMEFNDLRLQFIFIKATEGTSLQDTDFENNWKNADEIGLYRGAYHFYIPWKDARPQAERFIAQVTLKSGDLPPVLDFEKGTNKFSSSQIIENITTWLKIVEKHYNVKPIIYTNANFYKRYIAGNLDEYPVWIADYSGWSLSRYPRAKLLFWQHSQSGYASGIKGPVDYNVFLGDADDLKQLTIQ
jgi:lysozyme